MRRIAVLNQKGGVGKTTTAANLGAALARAGSRVLLIDLDPQAHLSLHFGVELRDDEPSVYDVLMGVMAIDEVARRVHERITLIPSDIDLAGAETELVSVMGREVLLREAVGLVADEDYDVLLIDCPPSLGVLAINALVAANEVMIPLQSHFLALQGLGRLFDTVTLVRQRINPDLVVRGIVLCMHDSTTRLAGEVVDDLVRFLEAARGTSVPWADARIYRTCIRRNIKLAECASFGQTIFDYAPRSHGAADYTALAQEIFGGEMPTSDGKGTPAGAAACTPATADLHAGTDAHPCADLDPAGEPQTGADPPPAAPTPTAMTGAVETPARSDGISNEPVTPDGADTGSRKRRRPPTGSGAVNLPPTRSRRNVAVSLPDNP